MTRWLDDTTDRIARVVGVDPARVRLADDEATALLDLAGFAARDSGERTNAPLLCHVLGMLRGEGVPFDELVAAVRPPDRPA